MPDVRASDPAPDDLTPEEQAADPAAELPDEPAESPEGQEAG
jgi:hypothetical protein